jgi:GGDEF domain-containing protein
VQAGPLVETALGLALVLIAAAVVPGQWGLLGVQPHPLWLVVLMIAGRYGSPVGYLAGALSALTYLALLASRPDAGPLAAHDLIQPFLLLIGGAMVSEVARAHQGRVAELEGKARAAEDALADFAPRYLAALEDRAELEKRIVGQTASIASLYDAARRLETLQAEELYPAILDVVVEFLEAEACALYLLRDGGLELRAARPSGADRPTRLDPRRGLAGRALRELDVITIRDRLLEVGADAVAGEPHLMAGPLIGREGAVGVVVVERVAFLKLTPTSARLLGLILDWASNALRNALLYERTRDRNVEDELTGSYTAVYTVKRLREEISRARLTGQDLSVAVIAIADAARVRSTMTVKLLKGLGIIFRDRLADAAVVGHHRLADRFVLILPGMGRDDAAQLAAWINDDVHAYGLRPYDDDQPLAIQIGLATLDRDLTADDLIARATADARAYPTGVAPLVAPEL